MLLSYFVAEIHTITWKNRSCLVKWKGDELEGDQNSGGQMVLLSQLGNPSTTATPSPKTAKSGEISSEGSRVLSHE